MTTYNLVGIDPGVRDTGLVHFEFDLESNIIRIHSQAWTGVTVYEKHHAYTRPEFLDEIAGYCQSIEGGSLIGIEGYRQRGLNIRQDARMLNLIQDLKATIPKSEVVDNTSIKKIVTNDLLKVMHASRFEATYHADLKSAARVALRTAIQNPVINEFLARIVMEVIDKKEPLWQFESTSKK